MIWIFTLRSLGIIDVENSASEGRMKVDREVKVWQRFSQPYNRAMSELIDVSLQGDLIVLLLDIQVVDTQRIV